MKGKIPGITREIRKILHKWPHSKPKEIARILHQRIGKDVFSNEREFYLKYRDFIKTEKWAWNRWLRSYKKGRVLKVPKSGSHLIDGHRIEWTFEAPLSQVLLQKINEISRNLRPGVRDPRPIDKWYVIPNRNRMREFHNHHITVRVFPKSGTVRILPSRPMTWETLVIHLETALFLGGLSVDEAEAQARRIVPHSRHKTFQVGRVDPFKIDYYERSLGLRIHADGSHPECIEVDESFPPWISPLLASNNRIVKAITEFADQIQAHLQVMKDIGRSVEDQNRILDNSAKAVLEFSKAVQELREIITKLRSSPQDGL